MWRFKSLKSSPKILTGFAAVVLLIGVFAAVLGSQQSQERRSRAQANSITFTEPLPETVISGITRLGVDVGSATYTNPVLNADRPDPSVLYDNGYFYMMHTTGPSPSWPLLRSKTLGVGGWEFLGNMLNASNTPSWMGNDLRWAPEIRKLQGGAGGSTYVIVSTTARASDGALTIALATAQSITGPYTVQNAPLVDATGFGATSIGVLDPHQFIDPDTGKVYLFWKEDGGHQTGMGGVIKGREMDSGGTSFIGPPVTVLTPTSTNWEVNQIEAPEVIKRNGSYYLFYSANLINENYAVGVARSSSPLGPYTKGPANPILKRNSVLSGPGHGSFVSIQEPFEDGSVETEW